MFKYSYWYKRPGIIDCCLLALRSLFSDVVSYYDEHIISPRSLKFLSAIQHLGLGRNIKPVNLDFNAKYVDGFGIVYPCHDKLLGCTKKFLACYAPHADEREQQMITTYLWDFINDEIIFITLVAEKIKALGGQHKIYIEPTPMARIIIDYFIESGITIRTSFGFMKTVKQKLIPLIYLLVVIYARLFPRRDKTNISIPRPAIWVEYYPERPNSRAFWRHYLQNDAFDLVYYLDRPDTPFNKQTVESIEASDMKWKWIDAHRLKMFNMARLNVVEVTRLFFKHGIFLLHQPMWFRSFLFQKALWTLIYTSVFRRYQVKVLFQHQDRGWMQAVQANALEITNGISVGYHWSNLPYCMEHWFLTSQHVYFVWGKAMLEGLKQKKNTCKYILPCGMWITSTAKDPQSLKDFVANKDFVISIFDTDVDWYLMMTPEVLSRFFLSMLKLLEKHHHWGGIIKSKNSLLNDYVSLVPSGHEIVSRFRMLEKSGRLLVMEPTKYIPITPMAYSNLAVCCAINSAGILSGIYGYRAIHWDCVGIKDPIYNDPSQKILFSSLEDIENAIELAAQGDLSIGDFSKFKKWVNYYEDFEGAKRIAWFFEYFMTAIESSKGNSDIAMQESVDSYIKHFSVNQDFFE